MSTSPVSRALAEASGFTHGEIVRRVLLSAEIPSARARQRFRISVEIQREQNRLGGLLKKALTEREGEAHSPHPRRARTHRGQLRRVLARLVRSVEHKKQPESPVEQRGFSTLRAGAKRARHPYLFAK